MVEIQNGGLAFTWTLDYNWHFIAVSLFGGKQRKIDSNNMHGKSGQG
jgi:hypothetical protein